MIALDISLLHANNNVNIYMSHVIYRHPVGATLIFTYTGLHWSLHYISTHGLYTLSTMVWILVYIHVHYTDNMLVTPE